MKRLNDADESGVIDAIAVVGHSSSSKLHFALFKGNDRVVPPHFCIFANPVLLASLADDDAASLHILVAIDLHSKHLRLRVS